MADYDASEGFMRGSPNFVQIDKLLDAEKERLATIKRLNPDLVNVQFFCRLAEENLVVLKEAVELAYSNVRFKVVPLTVAEIYGLREEK